MSQLKTNTTNLQTLLNKANALPQHLDTSDATATTDEILLNETAYVNGSKLTGTMPNNGTISSTMDGISTKSVTVPAGYTSGGTVSLDDTIDNKVDDQADLISQIQTALVGKTGGSVETYTLTINCTATSIGKATLHYIDTNGEYQTYSSESGSISLLKNSMIYVSKDGANCKFSTQGGLTLLYSPDTISSIFKINEDATISFSYGGGSD